MKKLILIIISLCIGIIIGYKLPKEEKLSFYGKVIEVNDSTIHVQGIPENDINHRGEFILNTTTQTIISPSKLPINSIVRVTYTGAVMESYPSQINEVTKIELIE